MIMKTIGFRGTQHFQTNPGGDFSAYFLGEKVRKVEIKQISNSYFLVPLKRSNIEISSPCDRTLDHSMFDVQSKFPIMWQVINVTSGTKARRIIHRLQAWILVPLPISKHTPHPCHSAPLKKKTQKGLPKVGYLPSRVVFLIIFSVFFSSCGIPTLDPSVFHSFSL